MRNRRLRQLLWGRPEDPPLLTPSQRFLKHHALALTIVCIISMAVAIVGVGTLLWLHFRPVPKPLAGSEVAACITDAVNGARVTAGVAQLALSVSLSAGAVTHSDQMQAAGDIFHDPDFLAYSHTTDGSTYSGENVGTGSGTYGTCQAMNDAFMASPAHRANILDPKFTTLGMGVSSDANDIYVTERFEQLGTMTPSPIPVPARTPSPPPTIPRPSPSPLPTVAAATSTPVAVPVPALTLAPSASETATPIVVIPDPLVVGRRLSSFPTAPVVITFIGLLLAVAAFGMLLISLYREHRGGPGE